MAVYLAKHDLCVIDIPKTATSWTKRVLGGIGPIGRDNAVTHGLPVRWNYRHMVTIVREPASWLGSAWGHRVSQNWKSPYPQLVPWREFVSITDRFKNNNFDEWLDSITKNLPGVVGWLYDWYCPPGVTVLRLEVDVYEWLMRLGGHPHRVEKVNVGTYSPKITPEHRRKVLEAERDTYIKYGYTSLTLDSNCSIL